MIKILNKSASGNRFSSKTLALYVFFKYIFKLVFVKLIYEKQRFL